MFRPRDDFTYLMPVHFGGGKFDPETLVTQRATGLSVTYETEKDLLENYNPAGSELPAPEMQVAFNKFTEIN